MGKIKKIFSKPVFTLVCYAMAILTIIYLLYTVKLANDTVEMYITQGTLSWSANFLEIISFFISNCASYIFYSFAFIFFGRVIDGVRIKDNSKAEEIQEEVDEEIKDEVTEDNADKKVDNEESDEKVIEENVNDDEKSTDKISKENIVEEIDNKEIDEKITDAANEDEN